MKAMILDKIGPIKNNSLILKDLPFPQPVDNQLLVKITASGVCHTELDQIEGRLKAPLPIIPGHQIVGRVEMTGPHARRFRKNDRVGIAWINSACGKCEFCRENLENLCPDFRATGLHAPGGYAEYTTVCEDYAYPIPDAFSDEQAAPLLCAGAIGYRAVKLTNLRDGQTLGLFGFGASAHIAIQIVKFKFPKSPVYVFTRSGQTEHQSLARKLGADWAGETGQSPTKLLDAAIDFTPAWGPVVEAMRVLNKAGRLVINAIRKEDRDKDVLLKLDYADHLWQEKQLQSVANITRADAEEFLPLAGKIPIKPEVQLFTLEQANEALVQLKKGAIQGAAVLKISEEKNWIG